MPFFLFCWQIYLQLFSFLNNTSNQSFRELSSVESHGSFSTKLDDWIRFAYNVSSVFCVLQWTIAFANTMQRPQTKNNIWCNVLKGSMNLLLFLTMIRLDKGAFELKLKEYFFFFPFEFNLMMNFPFKMILLMKKIKWIFRFLVTFKCVYSVRFCFVSLSLFTISLCFSQWKKNRGISR